MKIHNKRLLADKVLKLVKSELAGIESDESVSVESYQNGREQGHALSMIRCDQGVKSIWIGWAENRTSDAVVVYTDTRLTPGQGVSEEAYKNAQYFRTPEEACDCIIGEIIGMTQSPQHA